MKNTFKQSEASGTSSRPDSFKAAVVRLTAYYSIGVFIMLVIFSALVYGLFAQSIDKDIREDESRMEEGEREDQEKMFHSEAKENLLGILFVSDALLLLVAIFISYLLSKRTLKPLEEAYRKQRRFVADAAHELRTPLAVMKAGSEVISQKERSPSEYRLFISESREEVERLIKLSNDLLTLANSESKDKDNLTPVSLSDIANKQCESIMPYARTRQVEVHSDIEKGIIVHGSKDDMTRLVLNLLKNAIDYNKTGGNVTVSLSKRGGNALLSVKDSGIGIADEDLPLIFDRFYKVDSSRAQSVTSGSGLGLAIVSDIVTRHGGTIKVTSKIGDGTEFTVEMPFI